MNDQANTDPADQEELLSQLLRERAAAVATLPAPELRNDVFRQPVLATPTPSEHQPRSRSAFWLAAAALAIAGVSAALLIPRSNHAGVANSPDEQPSNQDATRNVADQAVNTLQAGEVTIWLEPSATDGQIAAVEDVLAQSTGTLFTYADHAKVYEELSAFDIDSPLALEAVDPLTLPTYVQVVLRGTLSDHELDTIRQLAGVRAGLDNGPTATSIAELAGLVANSSDQPVIVVSGAGWCPHCRTQLPGLVHTIASFVADNDVAVVGLGTQGPDTQAYDDNLWADIGWPYPVGALSNGSLDTFEAIPMVGVVVDGELTTEPLLAQDVTLEWLTMATSP